VGVATGDAIVALNAFANVPASSTDAIVVPAVANKRIRVLAVILQAGATATAAAGVTHPATVTASETPSATLAAAIVTGPPVGTLAMMGMGR